MLRGECDQLRQRLKQLEQQALDAEKEATRREQAARQLETQRVIELESNKYSYPNEYLQYHNKFYSTVAIMFV